MNFRSPRLQLCAAGALAATCLAASVASADEPERGVLVLASTNDPSNNGVLVFRLHTAGTPSLSFVDALTTGGKGGAGTNAGILQFQQDRGAVANLGSNSVTVLIREEGSVRVAGTLKLANGCLKPDSVALTKDHLFVVGANCAETHAWPSGAVEGAAVPLPDPSAAQIAVGARWAAVTLAHSPDSFAIVDKDGSVFPITGPTPPFPTNAPCWVAKGPGNAWYTGNSPGHAISIFFSD